MKVKLTNTFFYRGSRFRAGAILDLPDNVIPRSAKRLTDDDKPPREISRLEMRHRPRRDGTVRWQLRMGEVVVDEFDTKNGAEVARIDYEANHDKLRDRLDELDEVDAA